jgi:hypothetical protein
VKLKLIGGSVLGGSVLAMMVTLGTGGVAGATTVAVPIPSVGEVGVVTDNGPSGTEDCLAAQLDAVPAGPIGVCYVNAITPVGSNVAAIIVQHAGSSTIIGLNPFGLSSS